VFNGVWRSIGEGIARYRQYPRLVGETGGKDFVVVHESADVDTVVAALLRGAFEYQGQKCSAASRAYVPDSLWPMIRAGLGDGLAQIQVGDPADFRNFMGAVIDARAFAKLTGAVEEARAHVGRGVQEVLGGQTDDREGWFLGPTIIVATDPRYRTMIEELFGPVLTVHVYPTAQWVQVLELVDATSPYALTGAVFARDRAAVHQAHERLRHAAGNFYVNDKPTGAVVGQQPFGGSRASGTNDKAGSAQNLLRWISTRRFAYPFMDEM
jgi:1-pyrroline-5-carboxylate dehydrogenase